MKGFGPERATLAPQAYGTSCCASTCSIMFYHTSPFSRVLVLPIRSGTTGDGLSDRRANGLLHELSTLLCCHISHHLSPALAIRVGKSEGNSHISRYYIDSQIYALHIVCVILLQELSKLGPVCLIEFGHPEHFVPRNASAGVVLILLK